MVSGSPPVLTLQMSSLMQAGTWADSDIQNAYKKADFALRLHKVTIINAIVVATLAAIIGVGSFLALSGHLPHALNALQFLHQVHLMGSISIMMMGSLIALCALALHKKRGSSLQAELQYTGVRLHDNLVDKFQVHAERKIRSHNGVQILLEAPEVKYYYFLWDDKVCRRVLYPLKSVSFKEFREFILLPPSSDSKGDPVVPRPVLKLQMSSLMKQKGKKAYSILFSKCKKAHSVSTKNLRAQLQDARVALHDDLAEKFKTEAESKIRSQSGVEILLEAPDSKYYYFLMNDQLWTRVLHPLKPVSLKEFVLPEAEKSKLSINS